MLFAATAVTAAGNSAALVIHTGASTSTLSRSREPHHGLLRGRHALLSFNLPTNARLFDAERARITH